MKPSLFSFSSSLGAFAALILLGTGASADTESFTFNLASTDLGASVLNDTFNLAAFDPSLGLLTGVTLSLDLTTVASPQVLNASGGAGTYTNATTEFTTTFTGPDSTAVVYNATSAAYAGSVSGAAGSVTTLTGTPVNSSTSTSVVPGNFSTYEGTSPLSFTLVAPGTSKFTSGGTATSGFLFFGGDGNVGGTATVEYNFAAVPEPSAWALTAICMGFFAFLRFGTRRSVLK